VKRRGAQSETAFDGSPGQPAERLIMLHVGRRKRPRCRARQVESRVADDRRGVVPVQVKGGGGLMVAATAAVVTAVSRTRRPVTQFGETQSRGADRGSIRARAGRAQAASFRLFCFASASPRL
jgi:hypothetical protein